MTSESTRFLGHPKEMKPTVGAVGVGDLDTILFYRGQEFVLGLGTARWRFLKPEVLRWMEQEVLGTDDQDDRPRVVKLGSAGSYAT